MPRLHRTIATGIVGFLVASAATAAAEIKVMISAGFSEAFRDLAPEFERATGHRIVTIRGPSMGERPEAIPNRIARSEPVDVVIINSREMDQLIANGKVSADGRAELARALIGAVVRAGAPKPDISTVDALKRTVLDAKSVAYSDSGSGVYLSTVLFPRLGVVEQLKNKSHIIPGSVAKRVANGEYEIGFQTMSELLPVSGVDQLGPIPIDVQAVQSFSAAIATGAQERRAGSELIQYLSSPAASPRIIKHGMTLPPSEPKQ